jgi:RNA polymerase sigma factor (TIGR02999 family)
MKTCVADITDLLKRWSTGDQQAFDEMLPLVYGDLKQLAEHSLRQESRSPTLNCTALVHEAYLRLVNQHRMEWSGRKHFFGAAANVMRRVLVDHARQRLAEKRGAGAAHEPLDQTISVAQEPDLDAVALHEALNQLASEDPESARVVELRCFGGLSIEETAEVLETSPASVTRIWAFARAWLYRRLQTPMPGA